MKKILFPILVVALAVLTAIPALPAQATPADGGLATVTWLPPLSNQGEFQLKDGSTLPIKFTLTDPDTGAFVEDTSLKVDINKVLFRDDFERDSVGDEWNLISGSQAIVADGGDKVYQHTGGSYVGAVTAVAGDTSWDDYVLEVNVKKLSGTYFNLIFRYADPNNYYMLEGGSSGGTQIKLYKRSSGTFTLLKAVDQPTVNDNWYQYKIQALETNIKVWLNGVLKLEATDTSLTYGKIGIGGYNSITYFDDVMVLSLPAAQSFHYGTGGDNVRISYDTEFTVFADNFDDGNYDGWTPLTGDNSWSVEDGVLHCTPAVTYPRILADETMGYTDYVFEADARLVSGKGYALLFRATDYDHFYSFQYDPGWGFTLRLYQFTDFPDGDDVAPPVPYSLDYEWHHLKVAVLGNNIKCYVDGYKVFDVDDTVGSAPLTGGIGFRTWAGAQAEFDNVTVQVPHYIANLHTKESGMATGEYLITVWSGSGDQLGTYLFDLTDLIQGMGRGKGKA